MNSFAVAGRRCRGGGLDARGISTGQVLFASFLDCTPLCSCGQVTRFCGGASHGTNRKTWSGGLLGIWRTFRAAAVVALAPTFVFVVRYRQTWLQTPSLHEGAPPLCTCIVLVWRCAKQGLSLRCLFFFPPTGETGKAAAEAVSRDPKNKSYDHFAVHCCVFSGSYETSSSSTRATLLTLTPLSSVEYAWPQGIC